MLIGYIPRKAGWSVITRLIYSKAFVCDAFDSGSSVLCLVNRLGEA